MSKVVACDSLSKTKTNIYIYIYIYIEKQILSHLVQPLASLKIRQKQL
jgi:hypothetical protein